MRKQAHEPMCEFVAKFNKLVTRIPIEAKPTTHNLKCFFINTQLPEVSFLLHRVVIPDLEATQVLATSVEDDLILGGKIRMNTK